MPLMHPVVCFLQTTKTLELALGLQGASSSTGASIRSPFAIILDDLPQASSIASALCVVVEACSYSSSRARGCTEQLLMRTDLLCGDKSSSAAVSKTSAAQSHSPVPLNKLRLCIYGPECSMQLAFSLSHGAYNCCCQFLLFANTFTQPS